MSPLIAEQARRARRVSKRELAVVAIEHSRLAGVREGTADGARRARKALLVRVQIELHVIGHVEIQVAIAIVVGKSRVRSPTRVAEASPVRHIGKGTAMTLVVIEDVGSVVGHVQIGIAIIIHVADRSSHAVPRVASAHRLRNIRKSAVTLVAIVGIGARRTVIARQGRAIDDVQVEQAVAIGIEERRARADGFGHVLPAARAVYIAEVNASGRGSPRRSEGRTGR